MAAAQCGNRTKQQKSYQSDCNYQHNTADMSLGIMQAASWCQRRMGLAWWELINQCMLTTAVRRASGQLMLITQWLTAIPARCWSQPWPPMVKLLRRRCVSPQCIREKSVFLFLQPTSGLQLGYTAVYIGMCQHWSLKCSYNNFSADQDEWYAITSSYLPTAKELPIAAAMKSPFVATENQYLAHFHYYGNEQ